MGIQEPNHCSQKFERFRHAFAIGTALLLPVKLSLTYIFLIPAILLWLWENGKRLGQIVKKRPLYQPLVVFLVLAGFCSFFGINPLSSLRGILSMAFFSLMILVFHDISTPLFRIRIISCLVCAQAFAAYHSVLEGAFVDRIPQIMIGKVSESGQICLTLIIGFTLLIFLGSSRNNPTFSNNFGSMISLIKSKNFWLFLLNLTLFSLLAFAPQLKLGMLLFMILLTVSSAFFIFAAINALLLLIKQSPNPQRLGQLLLIYALPLIITALLVNLKRGPWCGAFAGLLLICLIYRKQAVLPLLAFIVIIFTAVTPLRNRLEQSSQHFFISGGRHVMWDIGIELASKYPLGIGFENSSFLREFSAEIPPEHDHFHNNFLNIIAETGWLCFGVFIWWILRLLKSAFRNRRHPPDRILAAGIGCSLIALLSAGVVEYNFGDSEVYLVLFLLVGILSRLDADTVDAAA